MSNADLDSEGSSPQALAVRDEYPRAEKRLAGGLKYQARGGVWRLELATNTLEHGEEIFQLSGINREDFPETVPEFLAMVYPADQEAVGTFMQDLLDQRSPRYLTMRVYRPDGELRSVQVQGELIVDCDGQPLRLVGSWNDVTDDKRFDTRLQQLLVEIGPTTGNDFFSKLAQQLCTYCEVDLAIIVQIEPEQESQCRTLAISCRGQQLKNLTYDLHGTPCAEVVAKKFAYFDHGVQHRFPEDKILVEWNVESYLGLALSSTSGQQFGFLCLMHSQPIPEPQQAELFLRVVAPRVAAEFEHAFNVRVLRQSEERFRALVEFGYEGLTVLDAQGRIAYTSPANSRLLGYESCELLNKPGWELIHPEDAQSALELLGSLRSSPQTTVETTIRFLHAAGGYRWLECRLTNLLEHPVLQGIVINWRDITDRRQAEETLQKTERSLALFRQIIDRASDAIEVIDPETGRVLDINSTACTMHKCTREEYLALHIPEVDPTVSNPADWARAVEAMRTNGFLLHQGQHRRKDGTFFPVEVSCTTLQMDREYVVAIVRDITERLRAEEALRESESRMRSLLQNLENVAVQAFESDGTITFWNTASERLYGYTAAEALGKDIVALLHGDATKDEVRRIISEALTSGQLPPAEVVEVVRRDGSRVHIFASRVLRQRANQPPEFFCFDVDVTERRRAEEELAVRQAELLHASRLNTVGEMVAAISHEVAQPLSAIGNFAATISNILETPDSQVPAEIGEYAKAILNQNRRCGAILQRLRDFSRRVSPPRAFCDLNQLLRDSVELMSNELRGLEVRVIQQQTPDLPPIYCDAIEIGQVVVNLLANARDACRDIQPPERRVIVVRSRREQEAAVFEVQDQGPGLTPESAQRLFEAFYTTKSNGMGIGLKICQSIVQEHQGRIEAVQVPTGGMLFRVSIPFPKAPFE